MSVQASREGCRVGFHPQLLHLLLLILLAVSHVLPQGTQESFGALPGAYKPQVNRW